jgi:hypothetical protein
VILAIRDTVLTNMSGLAGGSTHNKHWLCFQSISVVGSSLIVILANQYATNLPVPPTLKSQFGEISQLGRSICHYVLLVKVLKDLINVTASGTQMKYMCYGAMNGK